MWTTINNILGKQFSRTPAYIETENTFLTKPTEIANYFNDVFINKVDNFKQNTCHTGRIDQKIKQIPLNNSIENFEFKIINVKQGSQTSGPQAKCLRGHFWWSLRGFLIYIISGSPKLYYTR